MPELDLAWRGTAFAVAASVPTVAAAALLRGRPGLLGAALAAGLVVGLFALNAVAVSCVARLSPARLPAVSLAGAVVRMVAYAVLLTALAGVDGIDRLTTVIATCVLLAATLVYELRATARTPGFYWLRPSAPDDARTTEETSA